MNVTKVFDPAKSQAPVEIPWLPILMYHRVVDVVDFDDPLRLCVSRSEFETHMRFVHDRGYQCITVEDVAKAMVTGDWQWKRPIVISFDDGYQDNYTIAFPILKKYGLSGTIYLVTDHIGGTNVWDTSNNESLPVATAPLLNVDQIMEMKEYGISFGSHTANHKSLRLIDDEAAWNEMVDSKEMLENLLGHEVNTFCYPYGLSNPIHTEMVRQAGYVAALGIEQAEHTLFKMSRINPARTRGSGVVFRMKMSGMYQKLIRNRSLRKVVKIVRGFETASIVRS